MEEKKKIFDLLNSQDYGVISTVNVNQKPESAVMMLTVLSDSSILMGTSRDSRKYFNLKTNSHVSVISWNDWTEVQLEGKVKLVDNNQPGFIELKENLLKRHPDAGTRINEKTVFILIKPIWARYSALGEHPPKIIEVNQF